MQEMTAVETSAAVADAVENWIDAFRTHGKTLQLGRSVIWSEDAGVWIRSRPEPEKDGYWNGLGVELTREAIENEIVQVNPPRTGSPPGNNQGVIAKDSAGVMWIMHRGRMNVAGKKVELKDYVEVASSFSIAPTVVRYDNNSSETCFPVAPIGSTWQTVASTRKFVDLCRYLRVGAFEGGEVASLQRSAMEFEEPSGTYTIPPRDSVEAHRLHHDIWQALKAELKRHSIPHTNEKIGLLGPDLYTVDDREPMLFEIKTGNDASSILMAVGQLFVYEKLLVRACRKIMVLPEGIRSSNSDLIGSLGIEIIEFRRKPPSITIDWPIGFFVSRR